MTRRFKQFAPLAALVAAIALGPEHILSAWAQGSAFINQTIRIGSASPYTLRFPAADAAGVLTSDGAGVLSFATALNASNLTSGTIPDARLSVNVPLKDGTNTFTGTNTFAAVVTVGDLRGTPETITATGTVNDQALGATTTILRCNNASLLTITGITGGAAGRVLVIHSVGAGRVELDHQAAGSTAANRLINFATVGNTPLAAGTGTAVYVYDGTQSRWVLVSHEQGAWITPTFSAANFAGSGLLTWTVEAGDVLVMAHRLSGRTLSVAVHITTTSTSGTADTSLAIGNAQWGGFTATQNMRGSGLHIDAGVEAAGRVGMIAGGTTLIFTKNAGANWSAAASNNTNVYALMTFEVT